MQQEVGFEVAKATCHPQFDLSLCFLLMSEDINLKLKVLAAVLPRNDGDRFLLSLGNLNKPFLLQGALVTLFYESTRNVTNTC